MIYRARVNFKLPAKEHQTSYISEVTIVVYMGSEHIAATEKGEHFQSTLDGALNAVECSDFIPGNYWPGPRYLDSWQQKGLLPKREEPS